MLTPLRFEQLYSNDWQELETLLAQIHRTGRRQAPVAGERVAELYRRACEQLALARARAYPAYLVERLDQLTADAHQVIYQRREFGAARLRRLFMREFPQTVRTHARYVWLAALVMAFPMAVLGVLVYLHPELILSMVDAATAAEFETMYSANAESIGHMRDADTDWSMFGYYIQHNIGLAFQCFAGGLFAGMGSLFYLAYNGAFFGAIAGYITERGLSATFYSFIATHSAFELTALVLSGAAGLRLGHSMLAPGRCTRVQALVKAARESVVIIYGVTVMLLLAAAIEAFWSSAGQVPHFVKYTVAALCWIAVLVYLTMQGRSES